MRDRGASTAVGYVLTLGITLILVVALLSAAVSLVETERSRAAQSELSVLGNRLATHLAATDSMVRAAETPRAATVTADLPDRVADGQYLITIDNRTTEPGAYEYRVVLESGVAETSVAVHLKTGTAVEETTVGGGSVVVQYDESADRLEVES